MSRWFSELPQQRAGIQFFLQVFVVFGPANPEKKGWSPDLRTGAKAEIVHCARFIRDSTWGKSRSADADSTDSSERFQKITAMPDISQQRWLDVSWCELIRWLVSSNRNWACKEEKNHVLKFICSNPFCKWFWSGFWVPKHLLTGNLEH